MHGSIFAPNTNMKYLLSFLILTLSHLSNAQTVSIEKELSTDINSFAESIDEIHEFTGIEELPIAIKLFECQSGIGGYEDKDAILYDLFISVKQATKDNFSGEHGRFWIRGDFLNPRNYEFDSKDNRLSFEYGLFDSIESISFVINHKSIKQL